MQDCKHCQTITTLNIIRGVIVAFVAFLLTCFAGCWLVNEYDLRKVRAMKEAGADLEIYQYEGFPGVYRHGVRKKREE